MKKATLFSLVVILMVGCMQQPATVKTNPNERLAMATIFVEHAPEYKALCYQAYNLAGFQLKEMVKNKQANEKPAIVLDIDETVLNNIPFQAKQVLDTISYPSCWNAWCNLESAEPVPGVKEFLAMANDLGVSIFYVSNRKTTVLKATIANLQKFGLPQADSLHVMLKTTSNEKESRRQKLMDEGYKIMLLFGDNLSDFSADYEITDNTERNSIAASQRDLFGAKYIVLPNPGYGTWAQNLGLNNSQVNQDSLIRALMTGFECNENE
ncbi:MAG: 5'-nucleotidase, lipoprotein e(P4) family [Bacteroidales bacterium]|jgi:5'-nucleotidase (lipoprotein e(P4) family)